MLLKDFIYTTKTSLPHLKLIFPALGYKYQSLNFIYQGWKYRFRSKLEKFGIRGK